VGLWVGLCIVPSSPHDGSQPRSRLSFLIPSSSPPVAPSLPVLTLQHRFPIATRPTAQSIPLLLSWPRAPPLFPFLLCRITSRGPAAIPLPLPDTFMVSPLVTGNVERWRVPRSGNFVPKRGTGTMGNIPRNASGTSYT
jgi:hypothetical protein